ncbi:helix-turn-helix domain-containing protein [Geodermatophilus obscurus]|nr:helix-turn-helix domain-containing protein [Geodermatophilus obscurus]
MSWPRDAWTDAVWNSTTLKPLERLVALVYAKYAGDSDIAWVTFPVLMQRTGLSRDAASRALRGLESKGWLVLVERARQHHSARYRLQIPTVPDEEKAASKKSQPSALQTAEAEQASASRTAGTSESSVSRTAERTASRPLDALSRPSLDTSSPADGPETSERTQNTTTDAPSGLAVDRGLLDVIRANLPAALAAQVSRPRLHVASTRLAVLGWTSDSLGPLVAHHGWDRAGAGAVIAWLDGLQHPSDEFQSLTPHRPTPAVVALRPGPTGHTFESARTDVDECLRCGLPAANSSHRRATPYRLDSYRSRAGVSP